MGWTAARHTRDGKKTTSHRAFTLIELLIVVAIIAILAAIAIPNFLEAQTRSKVSRALADMRTVATAIESYIVDNNKFPLAAVDRPLAPAFDRSNFRYSVYFQLTTPISYITNFPVDAFKGDSRGDSDAEDLRRFYDYRRTFLSQTSSGETTIEELATGFNINVDESPNSWLLYSPGPDREQNINTKRGGGNAYSVAGFGDPLSEWPYYDPTNGTISTGDIVRAREGDAEALVGR